MCSERSKGMIDSIKAAICNSKKLIVTTTIGEFVVHPYMILKRLHWKNATVVRGFVEDGYKGHTCEIPIDEIEACSVKDESHYAMENACLEFNHREYEIVFPKPRDLTVNCTKQSDLL